MVFDPKQGEPIDKAEAWDNALRKQLKGRNTVKLLIGARVDNEDGLIDRAAIEKFRDKNGYKEYIETSALTGRGMDRLREAIAEAISSEGMTVTSRRDVFQRVRDEIESLQREGHLILYYDELVAKIASEVDEDSTIGHVVEQMCVQGIAADTRLASGRRALVLDVGILEQYAGSLIVEAAHNPRGVPVIEERQLAADDLPLPGIKKRVTPRDEECVVLECVVELLIRSGICFRNAGLLIFPTLFPSTEPGKDVSAKHSVSLYYDFSGAIDNIYASLVAYLGVVGDFGAVRLWANRAEFESPGKGLCGVQRVIRPRGFAQLDVFFDGLTPTSKQEMFVNFIKNHLHEHGIDIQERLAVTCPDCKIKLTEDMVHMALSLGRMNANCPVCGKSIPIPAAVGSRARNRSLDARRNKMKKKLDDKLIKDANGAKRTISSRKKKPAESGAIRILHLSDLHFTKSTSIDTKLRHLVYDIKSEQRLNCETLDYLVVSGDFTYKGQMEGIQKANEFILKLIDRFTPTLTAYRSIFVPGNHDIPDSDRYYRYTMSAPQGPDDGTSIKKNDVFFVCDKERYNDRFNYFSQHLYHQIMTKPYPQLPKDQGIAFTFSDSRIQFLTLNSCANLDQFNRKRSSVSADAVANLLEEAEKQVTDAIGRKECSSDEILRIAVLHHYPREMNDQVFMGHLKDFGVRILLHGDVHEVKRDVINPWDRQGSMYMIGAGSFAAQRDDLPESTPRLYNLIEIQPDLKKIKVYVRHQEKSDGPWDGHHIFPDPKNSKARVDYYDIDLAGKPRNSPR